MAPTEHRAGTSLDGQLVLCIDNEKDILDGMHGLLSKWGAEPVTASNRVEALAEMSRVRDERGYYPAILLVDYHLDDSVTGLEVIEALRDAAGSDLPAVILTADHTEEVIEQVRAAGHAILHKPIKPAALRALMTRVLVRRNVA